MKEYQAADIRNLALVGHGSAGKTMLGEAILTCGGVISRPGSVSNHTTLSDYHEDEQERQISIQASLLHTEWQNKKINIIDTPGYIDFISESLGALKVADCAVIVMNGNSGVELGTEQVWRYATDFGVPKMFVVNGLDKEHADFGRVLDDAREQFGNAVFPLTFPVNVGPGFSQIVDVIQGKMITYSPDGKATFKEEEVPAELKGKLEEMTQQLIEFVAESDDSLLEKFFEEGSLTEEEMLDGLHAAFKNQSLIPLFSVSSETNVGVVQFLDFVAKFGLSPEDTPTTQAFNQDKESVEVNLSDSEVSLYIFKTVIEPHIGELSFFRIYSGTVQTGMDLHNSNTNNNERVGQIYVLNGKNREGMKTFHAGDMGAFVKLKETHTGNTLCSHNRIITLPPVEYPLPNIHGSLKLKSKGEEDKMSIGLTTLHAEDPTFIYRNDPELHQTVISGQGELHLQVISARLKRRFNVEIELIKPKIPFRETIKAKAEAKYRHKKQTGGAGQFAEVWMRMEPKPRDSGLEFIESLVGQNVDRVFVPSVEKGVNAACTEGIIAGYRVVDVKVDFYDGKMHPVDSKDVAFQIAGKHAFRDAFLEASPCLLEPIYNIEVRVPEEYMGDVMGDVSSRRGKILGMDSDGRYQIVKAQVPEMELYHYSTVLRSITGGRGFHKEIFSHYEEMPRELEQQVIEESKKEHDEE